jgi:hypothetical protein
MRGDVLKQAFPDDPDPAPIMQGAAVFDTRPHRPSKDQSWRRMPRDDVLQTRKADEAGWISQERSDKAKGQFGDKNTC